jgi:hypothetical protein
MSSLIIDDIIFTAKAFERHYFLVYMYPLSINPCLLARVAPAHAPSDACTVTCVDVLHARLTYYAYMSRLGWLCGPRESWRCAKGDVIDLYLYMTI